MKKIGFAEIMWISFFILIYVAAFGGFAALFIKHVSGVLGTVLASAVGVAGVIFSAITLKMMRD